MKILLLIFISAFSLNTFAYVDSYNVVGTDSKEELVYGTVYTNGEPWEVRGQIIDKNGNRQEFWGRWNGPGKISGQTEEEALDLDLQVY